MPKNSSQKSEDILHSDANGAYDISFFGASISHSIETSKRVFAKFAGDKLSSFAEPWRNAEAWERDAFLLEHHELAHHALMYSTPAGVLNWRLNQLIARDIGYIFRKCDEFHVSLPKQRPPVTLLEDADWQMQFFSRGDGITPDQKAYVVHVVTSAQHLLSLRKIFFEPEAATAFSDLNFGRLLWLLNWFSAYATERCEVSFPKWKTRLPLTTAVFPSGKAFNVMDIAECHAIAEELFVLRALSDSERMEQRLSQSLSGPFGQAMQTAHDATKDLPEGGTSPYRLQLAAMLACCTNIDLAKEENDVCYLEDELPWWRLGSPTLFHIGSVGGLLKNLITLVDRPLYAAGSNWLDYRGFDPSHHAPFGDQFWQPTDTDELVAIVKALTSFGLDVQTCLIHRSAELNLRFLATRLSEQTASKDTLPFKAADFDDWREQFIKVGVVEYADGILFHGIDVDAQFGKKHPLRQTSSFEKLKAIPYQLLANIMIGATARCAYAAYAGKAIPSARILEPKLAQLFGNAGLARDICLLLTKLFDEGHGLGIHKRHLHIIDSEAGWNRYI